MSLGELKFFVEQIQLLWQQSSDGYLSPGCTLVHESHYDHLEDDGDEDDEGSETNVEAVV